MCSFTKWVYEFRIIPPQILCPPAVFPQVWFTEIGRFQSEYITLVKLVQPDPSNLIDVPLK